MSVLLMIMSPVCLTLLLLFFFISSKAIYTFKFEFHINFMCHKILCFFLFFFPPTTIAICKNHSWLTGCMKTGRQDLATGYSWPNPAREVQLAELAE